MALRQAGWSHDGDKRTGLACALVFLALADAARHVGGAQRYAITMKVATSRGGDAEAAASLRIRLSTPTTSARANPLDPGDGYTLVRCDGARSRVLSREMAVSGRVAIPVIAPDSVDV